MKSNFTIKYGRNLKKGDVIDVWWSNENTDGNWDEITRIETPKQTMAHVWEKGYRFAYFRGNKIGMTIPNDDTFKVRK